MVKYLLMVCIVLASAFTGCRKDDPGLTSTGYIAYRLDYTDNRLNDYDQPTGNDTLIFYNNAIFIGQTSTVSNIFVHTFELELISDSAIELKKYTFSGSTGKKRMVFKESLEDLSSYVYNSNSSGTIEITRFDTIAGGKVEGKFQLTNLTLFNKDNQPVSYNHNITGGTFSLAVVK